MGRKADEKRSTVIFVSFQLIGTLVNISCHFDSKRTDCQSSVYFVHNMVKLFQYKYIYQRSVLFCFDSLVSEDVELWKLNTAVHLDRGVALVPGILQVGHGVAKTLNLHSTHLYFYYFVNYNLIN